MTLRDWRKLIRVDYPEQGESTERTIRKGVEYSQSARYSSSSMRQAAGRVWDNRAYEARRQRVLSTPLP